MASGTWSTGFWGQNQWNDSANPTFTLTGVSLSGVLGTTTEAAGEINTGWGRIEWGINAWGEFGTALPTGVSASFNIGTIAVQIDVTATNSTNNNQTITGALGAPVIDIQSKVFPTGIEISSTLGIADAGPDAMATGNQATASVGSVEAYNLEGWGRYFYGQFEWGATGEWESVELTGIALSANLGNETITGNANVTANTLNVAQVTIANVDPAPDAEVTGNFMIGSLGQLGMQGDVPQDVTGIAMSAGLGSVVAVPAQEVDVTGLPALARVASVTATGNASVSLTGFALTMEQGSGSALIWNEVNTGTAPIDPPGWQEVAA